MLIACATDHYYAELAGVMMASLARNGDMADTEIVLFAVGLNDRDREWLRASAGPSIKVTFFDLDAQSIAALRRLHTKRHLNAVAYVRMLIPDLLPHRNGRLLYLDCDVVVNRSLVYLRDLSLNGLPLAAVHISESQSELAITNAGINRPADTPYFNSGVLLIDLEEWRRRDLSARSMEYAASRTGDIRFHDQDVLNRVVGPDWIQIDGTWNRGANGISLDAGEETAILHYKGKVKPLHSDYKWPAKKIYDRYRAFTPWANRRAVSKTERRLRLRWNKLIKHLGAVMGTKT